MSLGFNLGQTGNASEVGAGIVKVATQAQIDAGQADDGGVPLIATPDKLPKGSVISTSGLIAGEAITAGDVVAQVYEEYEEITPFLIDKTNETGNIGLANASTYIAQEFTTSADITRLKRIVMRFQNAAGVTGTTFSIRFRELANLNGGPDIISYNTTSFNGASVTLTVTLDNRQLSLLAPSTTYAIIVRFNHNGYAGANVKTDNSYTPTMYQSTDGAVTFSPLVADGFYLQLVEEERTVNDNEIVPANATALGDNVNCRLNVLGFAKADAAVGEAVDIEFGDIVTLSGLTPGQRYYLSDTNGQISTTPGTVERYIGYALSATTMLRFRGPVSGPINYNGSNKSVADGIVLQNNNGSSFTSSINTGNTGYSTGNLEGFTIPVRRGWTFSGGTGHMVLWDFNTPIIE